MANKKRGWGWTNINSSVDKPKEKKLAKFFLPLKIKQKNKLPLKTSLKQVVSLLTLWKPIHGNTICTKHYNLRLSLCRFTKGMN